MVAVGTDWTQINYWSNSIGNGVSAQVRLLGKVTQSISNNSSRLDFKWQKRLTGSGSAYNNNTYTFTVTMTGHSASFTFALGSIASTTWTDVGTTDYWGDVVHNNDGTLSVTYTATGYRFNGTAFNESGTITFPTIARASVPTVSKSAITLNGSDSVTITTNRASSSFTHTLYFSMGGYSSAAYDVGASYVYQPTVPNLLADMTSKQMTMTVTCVTYNGTTQLGSNAVTFKVNIDESVYHPSAVIQVKEDINTVTKALELANHFIDGYSNLSYTVRFSTNDVYSTLAKVVAVNGDTTLEVALSGSSDIESLIFNGVTGNSTTITVYDSRGVSFDVTDTVALVGYVPLSVIEYSSERVNANHEKSETGNAMRFTVKVRGFFGTLGQTGNSGTITYKFKIPSASTYTDGAGGSGWADTTTGVVEERTFTYYSGEEFPYTNKFEVVVTIADKLSTASFSFILLQGIPVIAIGADHFDIYGSLHIHDRDNPNKFIELDSDMSGLRSLITTQTFTSASVSCGANSFGSVSIPLSLVSGYSVVGVIQTWSNGNVVPCYCNGIRNGAADVWWRNPTGSAISVSFSVNVLFIRT